MLRLLVTVLLLHATSGATQSVIEHGFATFESDGTNDVLTVKNQGGSATYLKVTAGGDVDVGTTASTINIKGATYTPSDRRLKEDIADVADATTAIDALRGVRYSWIDEAADANGGKRRFIGFLAQEVEAVLPELVSTNDEGTKSVNYDGVIPVLVEALKEERAARVALAARLDAVEARLAALDTFIES